MHGRFAWGALLMAVVLATVVGVLSYNAGVSHALMIAPAAGAPPAAAVPYVYYRPWGFGLGFGPLLFFAAWFLFFAVLRTLMWGGMARRCRYGPGWRGTPDAFDEWHRRAHDAMNTKP